MHASRSNLNHSHTNSKIRVKTPKGHDNRLIELCYNGDSFIDFLGQFLWSDEVYYIRYSPWHMELSHTRLSLSTYMCSLPNHRCPRLYQYVDTFLTELISIEKQQTLLLNTWLYWQIICITPFFWKMPSNSHKVNFRLLALWKEYILDKWHSILDHNVKSLYLCIMEDFSHPYLFDITMIHNFT